MKIPPVVIVVVCAFLIQVTLIGSDSFFYHSTPLAATIGFSVAQAIAYFLYPLLGWASDVYFTRYKVLRLAFIIFSTTSTIVILATFIGLRERACDHKNCFFTPLLVVAVCVIIVCLVGLGLFEANAIQFGMEQILEASSDQLGTFIHWYYWSLSLGRLILYHIIICVLVYYSECLIHFSKQNSIAKHFYQLYNCQIYYTCLLIIGIIQGILSIVGLLLFICSKNQLTIEKPGHNPLKLVFDVIKYSWKHKVPEHRSAFTYWEEDIPRRIDLGKNKYGGPFTTEEVEDTKAFLRIILLLTTLVGFHLTSHGYQLSKRLMQNECPSFWVLVFVGEPDHLTTLTIVAGIPLYQLARHCCYSQRYFPNMLKRMGLGLLCCLAKEIAELVLQATQHNQQYCQMDIHQTNPNAAVTC